MTSGLSHNSVLCIKQDHNDIVWIGTREGLNKFNSVDVTIYKHKIGDSLSLSNNHINCIYETENNNLWVGTARGLNRYDNKTNSFIQYLPGNDSSALSNGYIRCIAEGFNNEIWIGTSYGLNLLNTETDRFEQIFLEEPPTLATNIIALFKDNKDQMWIGTKAGLYIYSENRFEKVVVDENIDNNAEVFEIRDIKQSTEGTIWIATENNGIYSMTGQTRKIKSHYHLGNSDIISNSVRKILIDDNELWLATLHGLSILNKETKQFSNYSYSVEKPEGIGKSSLHDIIKDQTGGFWIATYTDGINYFHPQNNLFPHVHRVIGSTNSLNSNSVTGFLEDKNGNMFIATGDGGLNYLDNKTKSITHIKGNRKLGLSHNNIKSLNADKQGNLWIGTYNGLNYFDRKSNSFTQYFHETDNSNSITNNRVQVVYVDEDGLVWLGMEGGIFQIYDPKTNVFTNYPEVGAIVTHAIFEDSSGKVWIGERFGLKCMDRRSKELIDISNLTDGLEEQLNFINWISEDKKGQIWIGTQSSGIIIFSSGKAYKFDTSNGLSDNTVNAILEDDFGNFWISTNKGISKIIYSENDQGIPQIESIDFTTIHGLQGAQFEQGCAYKSKSGTLYFGGINGYNAFMPQNVSREDYFPPVVFTDIQVNSKNKSSDEAETVVPKNLNEFERLELKYAERNIFVRFAGINFVNSGDTYYRYRLSDLDDDWVNLGNERTVNFTYLPVGEHELRIQSTTNPEIWGNEYRNLIIKVFPPWWLTWWAYVLYIFILIGLLYLFFNYSQRWARLKSRFQMEQFEREKEAELHESKLKFFTDVSHELRTPLTLILAPLEKIMLQSGLNEQLSKQLTLIQRNGNRMMQLIDQVLNLRKLETGHEKIQAAKGNIVTFLKEIGLSFSEIASTRNIDFEYRCKLEKLSLWYDRNKMEIIIFNLLSNAFKNTPTAGKIELVLNLANEGIDNNLLFKNRKKGSIQYAKISVIDNGKGIPKTDLENIFERFYSKKDNKLNAKGTGVGLELTKRMVELHKGKIEVESKLKTSTENGFTKFTVYLPIGKSHLTENEIVNDFKNSEDVSRYTKEIQLREKISSILPLENSEELPKISDKNKQTLLIVEDNAEVRTFVRDLFYENYLIEEAENGLIGWNIASSSIPDLVISDIMMPEMDGIELCRKLKSDIRTSHIPVVLLTARTTLTFKYEGLETGADEYITKPFSAQFLMLRVQNLIKQRNTLRSYYQRSAIMEPEIITVTSVDERLLKKAVDYINNNITNTSIGVEELSNELGLSRGHFYRKIKALTNLTAVDFIRSVRLKRAAMILQQGKLSIKEVQVMVGFEGADYFRKCFKTQFGMTPSEYSAKEI